MKFIVIGISDNPKPFFPPEVLEIIKNGKVFSGGKRHHEIVAPLLPPHAEWIDITVPLDTVFEQYHTSDISPQPSALSPHTSSILHRYLRLWRSLVLRFCQHHLSEDA